MNAFADSFGIEREDNHIHEIKWQLSPFDDGKLRYASVEISFLCGCQLDKIRKFANDMKKQMGRDVAVSTGTGSHTDGKNTVYSIRVVRNTLDFGKK